MSKGYWIAHGTVDDAAAYDAYRKANAAPLAAYGGKFLVRGGQRETRKAPPGPARLSLNFPATGPLWSVITLPHTNPHWLCAPLSAVPIL